MRQGRHWDTCMCNGNSILTNDRGLENEVEITNCMSEEADQRIVRLILNCSKFHSRVDALTIDTDVLDATLYQVSMVKVVQNFGIPGLNQSQKRNIQKFFKNSA